MRQKLRELIRISAAFSHTRHLKVFSNICNFAAENKGEILEKVDSSKIALLIKNRFGKEYSPRMIEDYLLTAEELNLVHRVSKIAYGLTDYGLSVAAAVSEDSLKSLFLTEFEKYVYLRLLVKNDYDYVLGLLSCMDKTNETKNIIESIISRSRCPSLRKLRECFLKQTVEIITDLKLGLEGTELVRKIEKMKERTLNHRLSSLLFWLTEIATGSSLLKPAPDLLNNYDPSSYLGMFAKLEKSLRGFDWNRGIEAILDEGFPQLLSYVLSIDAHPPRKKDSGTIVSGITAMLNSEWEEFVKLQPHPFKQRIPALPFLIFIQCRFLFENRLQLSFSNIMEVFRRRIQGFGYILTWRYDFHSGYIEKVS